MPRQLHLEGPVLEPLLEQARADHGAALRVVDAHRVRRGGFAGFFTREHYEVTVEVADPTGTAPVAASPGSRPGAGPLEDLLALADRSDGADTLGDTRARSATAPLPAGPAPVSTAPAWTAPPVPTAAAATAPAGAAAPSPAGRMPGRSLSTESRGFDEVLAALRADLLGPGPTDALDRRPTGGVVGAEADLDRVGLAGVVGVVEAGDHADLRLPADAHQAAGADHGSAGGTRVPSLARAWLPDTVLPDAAPPDTVLPDTVLPDTAPPETGLPGTVPSDTVLPGLSLQDDEPGLRAASAPAPEPTAAVPAAVPGPPAPTAATLAPTTAPEVPALDTARLVALARAVGADDERAATAAAEVVASGVRTLRHGLPLLAASLAAGLVPGDDARDVADIADVGEVRPVPAAGQLSARAGDVVVVIAAPHRADSSAAEVARTLGTSWLAAWSDHPGGTHDLVVHDARAVPALAGRARATGQPVVLSLPDPTLGDGVAAVRAATGRTALLRSLDPDLVVLVVDADASPRRQQAVTDRLDQVVRGIQRSLVLALVGCDQASAPLSHAAWPVATLDGRPATAGTWTGVLLDALSEAADR